MTRPGGVPDAVLRVRGRARIAVVVTSLCAGLVYSFGLLSSPYDAVETCREHGERFDDSAAFDPYREDLFPLSSKCNASFDLVPAWVNPALLALLSLVAVSAAVLIGCELARPRSRRQEFRRARPGGPERPRDGVAGTGTARWETGR